MKNRLYNVIKLCVMAVLIGVTGQVYAQSTPRLIVNDLTNGSATWYSDAGKTTKIDAVPYSATEQTLYIDIQPAEGYWTTVDVLNGKVEKFVKPSAAGTRAGSIALAQYALTKVDGQTYAKNGAGVYQVTIPGMGTETEANEITKFVLTADFYPYTDITASVADKELTYSGVEQKGETEVTFTGLLTGHKATITYNPAKGTTVNTYSNGSFGTDLKVTDDAGSDVTVSYSLKTTTAGKLTIKPAPLTVTAKDKTIKYGDEGANDGVTYEGFVNSETASVLGGTLSYAYKTKEDGSGDAYTKTSPVGTYYIIPSGLTSANYDITFKAGKLTVSNSPVVIGGDDDASATATIEVSPKEFTYNGKDQKPEVTITLKDGKKVIDGKEYTVTYKKGDTEVSETKDAGTYTVVISNKTGADYAFSGKTTADYTIKPKALTITAKAKTIKYGDEAANDGVTYEGFVNSETASVLGGTLSYAYKTKEDGSGDAYTKTSPVGTYYIIPSGLTSANYDITFKAGKLTVSNSPVVIGGDDDASATATIEVSPKEFTYNGKDQKPEVKVVMKDGKKVIDSKEYTVTYKKGDTEVSETKDAGTYTVVISNKTGADYAFSGKTTADYTIKPKALTITAKDKTIKYGDEAANDGVTYEGFVNSETASVLGGTLSYAYKTKEDGSGDAYTKTSPVGTYYIIPSGLTSANYDITFKAGKLTVSNSPVVIGGDDDASATATIEVSPKEFTYNGKDQKPEVKVVMKDGKKVIDSKEYTVTYKKGDTEVSETKDAGTYTVVISNKTGADYAFSGKTTADYTIKPKALTITADAKSKAKGEADPALTYKADGLVEGDAITGALQRVAGEEVGTYAINQGSLSAGINYTITFTGALLTITASNPDNPDNPDGPNNPDGTTYQVIVMKSEGGEVISTHVQAKQNQQVNLKIVPATGYFLANLSVKLQSGGRDVSTRITVDEQDNMYHSFLMPAGNVVVTATFEKTASNQNIFIFRAKYGEVVSHVLHADPGQQVNLETRVKNGFTNVELDELYVFNEKGKRLTINTIMDPTEGLVYYFFMEGERAYVFNTFKGLNDILDLSQPVLPDNILYLLNLYSGFLNTNGGAGGVQVASSLLANILAKFTSEGGLSVTLGEDDLPLVLLNLKSGWKIKFDFSGNIQIVNPEMLGLAKGATLTSGQFYELLTPGNLELLLNSSYRPLLIKSITVVAPETEDPTAISRLQADEEAGDTYDLSGRKVDVNTLRKGVYIRDGRKIVIK